MNLDRSSATVSGRTHETIESVAELERGAEAQLSRHQRWIERTTSALGRPRTVYLILAFVIAWIVLNVALALGGHAFDPPPFAYLDCLISLAALLMTISFSRRKIGSTSTTRGATGWICKLIC